MDYTLTVAGDYTISIVMGGTHIQCGLGDADACSPFTIHAEPAEMSFETTDTAGPGLFNAVAGDVHTFTVTAYDTYGNRIPHGGDELDVTVVHTDASLELVYPGHVQDMEDGTYVVTYTVEVVGLYEVHILHDGQHILTDGTHTPATPLCVHTHLHGPSSVPTGAGLSATTANEDAFFTVFARDPFSNPRVGDGPDGDGKSDVFQAVLTGPNGETHRTTSAVVTVAITATGGTFTMSFNGASTPALPHDVHPSVLERELALLMEDPFTTDYEFATVSKPPPTSAWSQPDKLVQVWQEPGASPAARSYRVVFMSARHLVGDADAGIPAWNTDNVGVDDALLTGAAPLGTVTSVAATGTYPMRYNIHVAGAWSLAITSLATGAHIDGSPYDVQVAVAVTDPGSSTATGQGLISGIAGELFEYTVQANDLRVHEVQSVSTRAAPVATVDEVQTILCSSAAGSFDLSFRALGVAAAGTSTVTINAADDFATVQAALNSLDTIDAVTVAAPAGSAVTTICDAGAPVPIEITFTGAAVRGDLPDLVISSSSTDAVVAELVPGAIDARAEVQLLICDSDESLMGEDVTLTWEGMSVDVPVSTDPAALGGLLETAFGLAAGSVTTAIAPGSAQATICMLTPDPVHVTFTDPPGDVAQMTAAAGPGGLTGAALVMELVPGVAGVWGYFQLTLNGWTSQPIRPPRTQR